MSLARLSSPAVPSAMSDHLCRGFSVRLLGVNMSVPSARRQVLSRWELARTGTIFLVSCEIGRSFMRDRI